MKILIIRHAQSIANTGENDALLLPDHLVPLSAEGEAQTLSTGEWLARYCLDNGIDLSRARIWHSPFVRTRQTAALINRSLGVADVREDVVLSEQYYGLFDALPMGQWPVRYPDFYAEFVRVLHSPEGKFWARPPMGESPFDVSVRMGQFVDRVRRDEAKDGPRTLFVVTHGAAMRTLILRLMDYGPAWYQDEHNPPNCAIRLLSDGQDMGYIH